MSDFDDKTPVSPGRARRSTLGSKAKKWVGYSLDKLVPAIIGLGLAWLMVWQARLSSGVSDAKDVAADAKAAADTATAQGTVGQATAATAKVETAVAYDVTTAKAVATVEDLKKLTARVNSLEAELARLRSRKRRDPIKLSPKTTAPPPATPAAAVEKAAKE